jgi:uncharacterized membrane protein YidH (DUF202 family)
MGFGFVVARFGLFLREIAMTAHRPALESTGVSLWIGTGLLVIGVAVNIAAAIHHIGLIRKLNRGDTIARPSAVAIGLALTLAILGLNLSRVSCADAVRNGTANKTVRREPSDITVNNAPEASRILYWALGAMRKLLQHSVMRVEFSGLRTIDSGGRSVLLYNTVREPREHFRP